MDEKDPLVEALEHNSRLLAKHNRLIGDWKWLLFRSALMGLGSVIGATVLLGFLVWMLQPFTAIQGFGDAIDRLTRELGRE
jgi:hypothetical protein